MNTLLIKGIFVDQYSNPIQITIEGTTPWETGIDGLGKFYFATYDDEDMLYIIDELSEEDSKL